MKKKVKKDVKVVSKKKNKVILKKKNEKEVKNNEIENDLNIHNENENYGRIKWSLQVVDIDKLKPYEKNPRTITEEALNELASSFNEIGMCQPLVVSHDYSIISGNARYLQLKKEGCDKVQVMIPDRKLTEKQEKAVVIRMNKTVVGKWDYDVLANNYEVIDLMDWGFTTEELIGVEEEKIDPKCDEDEVPEVKDTITKRGDIWLLGNHRVMCGDSTMIDDVEKLMKGDKADMVFTDPPYKLTGGGSKGTWGKSLKGSFFDSVNYKDSKNEDLFNVPDFKDWFNLFQLILNEDNEIFVMSNVRNLIPIAEEMVNHDYKFHNILVMKKDTAFPQRWYSTNTEFILYMYKGAAIIPVNKCQPNWYEVKMPKGSEKSHVSQKPVELIQSIIENHIHKKIFEPFLGSGSTLIACEKTNRKCYGMELDEHYCDVIVNRWQKYTGKEAVLESTGEKYNNLIK